MNSLLTSYFPIAEMVAQTFGKNCEVVIHDLSHPRSSVVYVANGTVTKRKVGQSFNHLINEVLLNKNFKDDCTINYTYESEEGKHIKSSSSLIRDAKGEVIGMFCINYDLTLTYALKEEVDQFLPAVSEPKPTIDNSVELLENGEVTTIINNLIDNIIGDTDVSQLKRKDNLELVEFMEQKGIFLVKGAIDKVALRMGISKVTVYSYLDEIRNRREKE